MADIWASASLNRTRFDALVLGLPWQHVLRSKAESNGAVRRDGAAFHCADLFAVAFSLATAVSECSVGIAAIC